ncbi:hypothetical protein BT93_G2458 [Corymbia citriodora subsp. variegata]|nr:hypothetical protein BT93_G2458 [Corymbia citriodora subsp. variegata]
MAKQSDVHVADNIIEDRDLNTPKAMTKGTDQHDPVIIIKESDQHPLRSKWNIPISIFSRDACIQKDELNQEIWVIALPAALALAADPIASLIDTAFIGHLGPVEIAAVGVAIAIFNQASRIAIFPVVSITTSFVAEEEIIGKACAGLEEDESPKKCSTKNIEMKESMLDDEMLEKLERGSTNNHEVNDLVPTEDFSATTSKSTPIFSSKPEKPKLSKERRHIPSASTALVLGGILGLLQTVFLIFGAKPLLAFMGVKSDSPMMTPARKYLTLRSLGAPAVLLSLAMQGVFRGLKDTKTPLYAIVAGDLTNIALDPILIFACHLGVSGAAIAHVLSQYLISLILLWRLMKQVDLLRPSLKDLQLGRFLKNGFLLLARVIAATICVTLAASLAARLGSIPMAAFQVCLQVWMTSSLLADGLAVAGQAILATAFAEKDYDKATTAGYRVLQVLILMNHNDFVNHLIL